ncbi:DUF2147 domain-containing protein [Acinetobacter sp. ANC 4648]|uniref:DUF2147 domain-containing protein n=1 Tax=Acinetobacter sp. ANC 4648 TaxID=1977875 RepID=UPI000A3553D5|nr:DUF2147 domain-containing protein [Acinetobacter sp. ANC 4648]OTG80047.1 signal peptidase [Acinetobacter sp. ANC 4648]
MGLNKFILACLFSTLSCGAIAQDITGIWKNIDDKTGSSKAILEIRKESNGSYTGKIIKITPRPGYTPKDICVDCPAPYTNKPILGLDVLKGLQFVKEDEYNGGRILDPLTGKIYSMKAKLSTNGKRLQLRGYVGVSALGRSQTWIRD